MSRLDLDKELGLRAFRDGFAVGADPRRAARRHIVEPETHVHWRAGFEAGRAAIEQAVEQYQQRRAARALGVG